MVAQCCEIFNVNLSIMRTLKAIWLTMLNAFKDNSKNTRKHINLVFLSLTPNRLNRLTDSLDGFSQT